jgi:hypothetical protein
MIVRRPDPLALYAFGLRNLLDLAVLTHIAETGTTGATTTGAREAVHQSGATLPPETIRTSIMRLSRAKLITRYSLRRTGTTRGRCGHVYVLTKGGLKLFTLSPDISIHA